MPDTVAHRPRPSRGGRVLLALLLASVLANAALWFSRDPAQVGHWRSAQAREAYLAAYDEVARRMPPHTESRHVVTSYGLVHVRRYGPEAATGTPLLLLPGWGAGIPMWLENLGDLARTRTVYAVDALGDAGQSVQSVPLNSLDDEAAWVSQVIEGLGLPQVHLLGHSFGGRLAANVALKHPRQVASLTLLEPAVTLTPLPWSIILATLPSQLPFLPQRWRDAGLARISGAATIDHNDPLTRMIDVGTSGYHSARSMPAPLTDDELRRLGMPVYIGLGGNSALIDKPEAAAARARRLLRRGSVTVFAGAGHSLPMEKPREVDAAVGEFLAAHER